MLAPATVPALLFVNCCVYEGMYTLQLSCDFYIQEAADRYILAYDVIRR
jgi:hypothetical protein